MRVLIGTFIQSEEAGNERISEVTLELNDDMPEAQRVMMVEKLFETVSKNISAAFTNATGKEGA